jgi:hypothetical protein
MRKRRILLVGLGNLGSLIFDSLLRMPGEYVFLVGGQNMDYLHQRTNLSLLTALQAGHNPDVTHTFMDLWNLDQTAEIIARFQPDMIICTATLARWAWGVASNFSHDLLERLIAAPMGPLLPLHLILVYKLMQAVRSAGQEAVTLNAIYPDVVNPVLSKVGLAPTSGIGDLANNIPAVRKSIAVALNKSVASVEARLIMARYVSYWMSRRSVRGMPFHFTALVDGEDQTHLMDAETIFAALPTTLKRVGGHIGLLMTASSAMVLVEGIMMDRGVIAHAPGPHGLPGGYPVQVNAQGVDVVLPKDLTMMDALRINEEGLLLDGIERIGNNGTVFFAEGSMASYKEILGYDCKYMSLSEIEDRAKELHGRYLAVAHKSQ